MKLSFDDVLRHLGEFGRYQKWMSLFLSLSGITFGIRMMISVFLLNIPGHRCAIPGYDNDTYDVQSDNHAHVINATIPYVVKDGKLQLDSCHIYFDVANSTNGVADRTVVACKKWVYDKSVFESTVSSELNFVCDNAILATHSKVIFMAGCFLGSFAAGTLGDKIGRKKALYLCLLLLITGGIILNWSSNFVMFVILRFINGASAVGVFVSCFVIGIEMVGSSKRVRFGALLETFFAIGMVVLSGLAYFIRDWHTLELATAIPVAACLVYWWIIPESPRWLLKQCRQEEAEVIIRRMADVNRVKLPDNLFEEHVTETGTHDDDTPRSSFFHLFTNPVMCIRTLIIFLNWFVVSMVYYGLSLHSDNLGAGSLHLNFLLVGLVEFPAFVFVILLLNKLGRKVMYCASVLVGGVSCILTIFTILYADQTLQWVTVLLAMVGKLGSTGGFLIIYIFSSELFPTVIRHSATGASSSCARAGAMVAPYVVDMGKFVGGDFGRVLPLLMFGSLAVLVGLLALFLPETLDRDLPETIEDGVQFGRQPLRPRSAGEVSGENQRGLQLLLSDSRKTDGNQPMCKQYTLPVNA
ncbi:organic cation transporter protein-like [Haliotis cracherodii]|uniref:organic cation transporter protein-like n=1 Tax=Haliotis cracherodii TaxID=6455 RepID=UPI0039E73F9C